MAADEVISVREFGRRYDVARETVGDLVNRHEIPTVPMINGKAKGLDRAAQRRLFKLLNLRPERVGAAAS